MLVTSSSGVVWSKMKILQLWTQTECLFCWRIYVLHLSIQGWICNQKTIWLQISFSPNSSSFFLFSQCSFSQYLSVEVFFLIVILKHTDVPSRRVTPKRKQFCKRVIIQSLNSNTRKKLYYETVFCIMNFAFEFEGDLWPNLYSCPLDLHEHAPTINKAFFAREPF